MAEQIDLYKGLLYTLPAQPKKELIQGYGLPKKEQKWKRTPLPANFDLLYEELDMLNEQISQIEKNCAKIEEKIQVEQSKKEFSKEIIKKLNAQLSDADILINIKIDRCNLIETEIDTFAFEEDRKCTEGIWFYNNGVPTYINGDNYHYLNWFKLNVGYPQFRDRDKRWFYHWELCDKDPECLGQLYGKQRRDGYSYRCVSIIYNRARKTFNADYGMMSMSKIDSIGLFKKGIDAFLEYPRFFKPQIQNAEDVKTKLILKTPQQKITYRTRVTKKEISLNSSIECFPTTENAMDGSARKIIVVDEGAKFPKDVKLLKWFAIGKICCLLGIKSINGKMLLGSTVNDFQNGGEDFCTLWDLSLHSKRTENNRTDSWLYRYFVDCADGMESFVDEYGLSVMENPEKPVMGIDGKWITEGSVQYITKELKAKKESGDTTGYYELKRQFPRCEEDMFIQQANDVTAFDLEKLYEQIEHNEISNVEKLVHRGNFVWVNGVRDSTVMWQASEQGRWLMYWMPNQADRNKWIMHNGKKAPANTHIGCFSLDPFASAKTVAKKNSMAASHGFRKFDMLEPDMPGHFVTEYHARPSDPMITYEDMICQCVFYGWKMLYEKNKNNCRDYFVNRGYINYLMYQPELNEADYIKNLGKKEEVDPGLSNTGEAIRQQMIEHYQNYIYNSIGINNETGKIGLCPFDATLKDAIKFDSAKWTIYDLTVSAMLCIIASKELVRPKRKVANMAFFPRYKSNGTTSTLIRNKP